MVLSNIFLELEVLESRHSGRINWDFEEKLVNGVILAIIIVSIIPLIGVTVLKPVSKLNADPKFGEISS